MAAPWAWAQSSKTARPWASAIRMIAGMLAGRPYRCTTSIAAVRSVMAASTLAGSRVKVARSMSAKTGRAPASTTELAVAAKVKDGTITSASSGKPLASVARCWAEVPELTATAWAPPTTRSENSSSKAATCGPWTTMPEAMTASTAERSRAPMIGLAAGMNSCGIRHAPLGSCSRPPRTAPPWPGSAIVATRRSRRRPAARPRAPPSPLAWRARRRRARAPARPR